MFKRFLRDEDGGTAIEYGLIASLFGVSMIAAFLALEVQYNNMFGSIETAVVGADTP